MAALATIVKLLRNAGAIFLLGTVAALAFLAWEHSRSPGLQRKVADIRKAASGEALWVEDDVKKYYAEKTESLGADAQALLATRKTLEKEWDANLLRQEAWALERAALRQELADSRQETAKGAENLAAERKAFVQSVKDDIELRQTAGFRKNLEMLAKVDPDVGADLVWYWPPDMAVRYLQELGTRQAAEVVAALVLRARKTQEEQATKDPEDRVRASKLMEVLEKTGFLPKKERKS